MYNPVQWSNARREHAWLSAAALDSARLICNPDLDGLLCLSLIQELSPRAEMFGFYTGDRLLVAASKEAEVREVGLAALRAIECDLYLMPSVGQHYTLAASDVPHLNPNQMRGLRTRSTFTSKYPLNTLVFLWKWFECVVPDHIQRSRWLRALLYPDGVLLKVVENYQQNCAQWLSWMGLGLSLPEVLTLARDSDTRQLARCIYRAFGNTQVGMQFEQVGAMVRIANADLVNAWLQWFAGQLGIRPATVPQEYVVHEVFVQHRITENIDARLAEAASDPTRLRGEKIVSEALVRANEWSVTMRRADRHLATTTGLPKGLTAEPARWVSALDLNRACERAPAGPCRLCVRRD